MTDKYQNISFEICTLQKNGSEDPLYDPFEAGRIRVRIPGTDDMNKPFEELPFCFPLLPKTLGVMPKEGENVIVFFQKPYNADSFRLYIGPIILQEYNINKNPGSTSDGKATMSPSTLSKPEKQEKEDRENKNMVPIFSPAPSQNAKTTGTIPPKEATVIKGRLNTDIVLKDDEIQIRDGFKENPSASREKKLNYNPNLSFIQLKYRPTAQENNGQINIVSDKINLLTRDNGFLNGKLGEANKLISDETMAEISEKAHPLPYGDDLVAFLKDFVRVFKEHSHPFHQMPPCLTEANNKAISIDLNKLLAKSIRIN